METVGESYYQDAFIRICGGKCYDGYALPCTATLVAEPNNPHDRNAIAVYVHSMKVGHLSRNDALRYKPVVDRLMAAGHVGTCEATIVGGWDRGNGDEGHFGIVLDLAVPEHAHPDDPAPPPKPSRHAHPDGIHTGATGSPRSDAGLVHGKHYTEWVEAVKSFKRLGELDAAQRLLVKLCDAAEAEAEAEGFPIAPWYFEQLAIVERKRKNYDAEVAILTRYVASPHAVPGIFDDRLAKARELATKKAT